MLVIKPYDRMHAQSYARRWALSRNPVFYNFDDVGGDCTNFVSQCLYAGSCVMNYTPTFGWYYISEADRAPAWSGVEYLYNFLTQNQGEGPFGIEARPRDIEIGDIVQLGDSDGSYYHTLLICGIGRTDLLVCAHTDDALDRRLSTYRFARARFIHIEGVRFESPDTSACFDTVYNGKGLVSEAAAMAEEDMTEEDFL